MCILAIDPNSEKTGYAAGKLTEDGTFKVFKRGVLLVPRKVKKIELDYADRVKIMRGKLDALLDELPPVDEMVIELPHANPRNLQASIKIAMLTGVFWGLALECEAMIKAVHFYPPAQWKAGIVGNGNAKKVQVKAALLQRYGVTIESEDEADAYAILLYHWETTWERVLGG